jgi:radical SAM superfamily enzyme YgiQ (UPF0313 family)
MKKKLLLITPDAHMHKLKIGSFVRSSREAPLTLTTLAALTPSEEYDIKIIDESIDKVIPDFPADLVGISVMTGTANRAYELADHFRARKIPVVLGGVHVTIMPEEAQVHADSIVIGMAESTWPMLLADFALGNMKPSYMNAGENESDVLTGVPSPRIDLLRRSGYMIPDSVQATRGCKHNCDFCTVPVVWKKYYKRPIADIVRDVKRLPGKFIAFNDVSLNEDPEYAKELFKALIPLKKKWGGLATTLVVKDRELIDLMSRSGCIFLLLGFENSRQETLRKIGKGFNHGQDYVEVMKCLHSYGISVQGCFVFGFDEDDVSIFSDTVDLVMDLRIDIPRYSIYTPYPKTLLFNRMEREKRILSYNWDDYDTMHVVIEPKLMTPKQLYDGFKWAYNKTFSYSHIGQRVLLQKLGVRSVVNFFGNLTYRIFVHRLYNENRFAKPHNG